MLLRRTNNLGYPVDLFNLCICVCWYDLRLIWATRLICFICLFVYVGTTYNWFGPPGWFVLFVYLCMLLRLTTNLGYPVDLLYFFIRVCWYDLQLIWATWLICLICSFVYILTTYNLLGLPGWFVWFVHWCMFLRLTTNLGYPVDLFNLFICVCCYDVQTIWATRLICLICVFVYVGTTYD